MRPQRTLYHPALGAGKHGLSTQVSFDVLRNASAVEWRASGSFSMAFSTIVSRSSRNETFSRFDTGTASRRPRFFAGSLASAYSIGAESRICCTEGCLSCDHVRVSPRAAAYALRVWGLAKSSSAKPTSLSLVSGVVFISTIDQSEAIRSRLARRGCTVTSISAGPARIRCCNGSPLVRFAKLYFR